MAQFYPDYLYRLSQRDLQVTPLEIIQASIGNTSPLTAVSSGEVYRVPRGRMLIVESAIGVLNAGNAQNGNSFFIQYLVNGSLNNSVIFAGGTITSQPNQLAPSNTVGQGVLIPEGAIINGIGYFSGAVNPNNFSIHLNGILIPRGNFAI